MSDEWAINMKSETQKPQNRSSSLLSREENEFVFRLLGSRCQSLATAVIQLFLTDPPDHSQWRKRDAGVLCLVKDHTKRSYFFRIYCLSRHCCVWEHEVYNSLDYIEPYPWLHTFEAENAMAAFNFANVDEARSLRDILLERLESKKQRKERKSRQFYSHQGSVPNLPSVSSSSASVHNGPLLGRHHRSTSSGGNRKKDKESKKRHLTKADIGTPQDFRHITHVGWDPNRGFDVDNVEDPNLIQFFKKAGVSETQLRDKETREFIYEFIQRHGGLDAVKEDVVPVKAPPVPARAPPPPSQTNSPSNYKPSPPPPPPPPQQQQQHNAHQRHAQGSHQRTAPPPPPPPPSFKPTAHQQQQQQRQQQPVVSPVPPPPPPPPPPASDLPPPQVPDTRAALLEEIRSQKSLRPVEVEKKSVDSRSEMLDQIRIGVELRKVPQQEKTTGGSVPGEGLASALARALQERSRAFGNDSDSDTGTDAGDSDSDWEE